jgi:hypothetical protein
MIFAMRIHSSCVGGFGRSVLLILASATSVTVSRQAEEQQHQQLQQQQLEAEDILNHSTSHPNSVYSEFSKYSSPSLRVFYQTGVSSSNF